jgi:hypothetical protein
MKKKHKNFVMNVRKILLKIIIIMTIIILIIIIILFMKDALFVIRVMMNLLMKMKKLELED